MRVSLNHQDFEDDSEKIEKEEREKRGEGFFGFLELQGWFLVNRLIVG